MFVSPESSPGRNFYPRPPRGGRRCPEPLPTRRSGYFYPRPPRGGRQDSKLACTELTVFLSTPSARRATDRVADAFLVDLISIHALREEGDSGSR